MRRFISIDGNYVDTASIISVGRIENNGCIFYFNILLVSGGTYTVERVEPPSPKIKITEELEKMRITLLNSLGNEVVILNEKIY